jgi:hypothetical protein
MHRRPSFHEERSGIVEANVHYHSLPELVSPQVQCVDYRNQSIKDLVVPPSSVKTPFPVCRTALMSVRARSLPQRYGNSVPGTCGRHRQHVTDAALPSTPTTHSVFPISLMV